MNPNALHQVAVAGASGRMGHMLIEAVIAADDCQLAGALDIASSPAIGQFATCNSSFRPQDRATPTDRRVG